jgi:murein DD-endopeptidase MepM/ murein hydrolase activator NlpD
MAKWVEPFPTKKRGDEFGNLAPYRKGRPHRGLDWSVAAGSVIRAIGTGQVKVVDWSDGLGWYLIHSADAKKYYVIYAHLKEKPSIPVGTLVAAGETVVGIVGNTGSLTTGPHLHLSVATVKDVHLAPYNKLVDPAKLFEESE